MTDFKREHRLGRAIYWTVLHTASPPAFDFLVNHISYLTHICDTSKRTRNRWNTASDSHAEARSNWTSLRFIQAAPAGIDRDRIDEMIGALVADNGSVGRAIYALQKQREDVANMQAYFHGYAALNDSVLRPVIVGGLGHLDVGAYDPTGGLTEAEIIHLGQALMSLWAKETGAHEYPRKVNLVVTAMFEANGWNQPAVEKDSATIARTGRDATPEL